MAFPQGQLGLSKNLWDYTFNVNNFSSTAVNFTANQTVTIVTLTGRGIVNSIQMSVLTSSANNIMPVISIDGGADIDLAVNSASTVFRTILGGSNKAGINSTDVVPSVYLFDINTKFKTSFAIKLRNLTAGTPSITATANTIYYT